MRIVNQTVTVRSVLFSRISGVLYFLIFVFFIYKCLELVPIWLTTKEKATEAEVDYEKRVALAERRQEERIGSETEKGKERYQKDFFNKLDEGEQLIVLYKEEQKVKSESEEIRRMFWWEEKKQDFLVWWRNYKM